MRNEDYVPEWMKEITAKIDGTHPRPVLGDVAWRVKKEGSIYLLTPIGGFEGVVIEHPELSLIRTFPAVKNLRVAGHGPKLDVEVGASSVRVTDSEWRAAADAPWYANKIVELNVFCGDQTAGVIKRRNPSGWHVIGMDGETVLSCYNAWKDSEIADRIVWHTIVGKAEYPYLVELLALLAGVCCMQHYSQDGDFNPMYNLALGYEGLGG